MYIYRLPIVAAGPRKLWRNFIVKQQDARNLRRENANFRRQAASYARSQAEAILPVEVVSPVITRIDVSPVPKMKSYAVAGFDREGNPVVVPAEAVGDYPWERVEPNMRVLRINRLV